MDIESRGRVDSQFGADAVQFVMEVYERGLTVDALRRAESIAPLRSWRGASGCALAARIAANAGAPGLATWLAVRARRRHPNSAEALAQYSYELLSRRGPLALWSALQSWQPQSADADEHVAEILAVKGRAAATLRDFASSAALIDRAESIDPNRPWIRLQRATLLQYQDRIEAALEVAEEACALHPHPHYRPGVQSRAYMLQSLDRDEDAIELLRAADGKLQSGPIAAQLYSLLSENGRWSEAEAALQRFVELSPLLEAPGKLWVNTQQVRVAYRLGRRAEAARIAATLNDEFHERCAARVAAAPPHNERIQLDVQFVRQHFKTCAPATLASLATYWDMPAEHVKIVEAVCYDGTPAWQQRDWAERNGWLVREFRVTHEVTTELIERGIPFAISVVDAMSAHMMAVIGFDRTLGTILLRDPAQPYVIETDAQGFIARYRAFGPRGMVFVPLALASRLRGLELPDMSLYDGYHRLSLALAKHDRAGAVAALARIESKDSDAMIAWEARLSIAYYDANAGEATRCLERLLELYPEHPARQLQRLNYLPEASRGERIALLRKACAARDVDPALLVALSRALQGDARCAVEARRLALRALRYRPLESSAIAALADLEWESGRLNEATDYYRFAANLEGFQERLYQSWFIACRQTGRTEDALEHLQDRFARFGARSEQPALTLAWALVEVEQPAKARGVLDEAIRLRPADGTLLLRAAVLFANANEFDEAERLLSAAKSRVHEGDWLRARMQILENQLDFTGALELARELLDREPLALDAHGVIARSLARLQGVAAAREELRAQSERFPHHYGLQRMLAEWSYDAAPAELEAVVRKLLERDPSDAWARRELALVLQRQRRGDEALIEATEAARIEPWSSYSWSIVGSVYRTLGRIDEARSEYRRAIQTSADNSDAIRSLLDLARNDDERRADLTLIERELVRQVLRGDGLLTFAEVASSILDRDALLRVLRDAHAERPDLWHAWSAFARKLGEISQLDEALAIARQACERFPHLPRIWLDLANVHRWRNEGDLEIQAAERAFNINPAWGQAALALAAGLIRMARLEAARDVLQRALRHSPRDAQLHASHADVLWRLRDVPGAFAAAERALRVAPGYEWPWELLAGWAAQCGEPERTAAFARQLTREAPGEARRWMMLAKVLSHPQFIDERLSAIDRALQLDVHCTEAWDMKAQFLTNAERFDAAILACDQGIAACHSDLHLLRGRRAWVDARRGRVADAVQTMRDVLAQNAGYVWGWHQLSEWLLSQDRHDEATAALERLQQLLPHDPWVSRQIGMLKLERKDPDGARAAFARALSVAPDDENAAHHLFDLQLNGGDLAGAADTLGVMQLHQPGAATLAAEIHLRLREKKIAAAIDALKKLCESPHGDPWPLDSATDAFARSGILDRPLRVLRRAIRSGAGNSQCAAAAVRLLVSQDSPLAAAWLFLRLPAGEMQRRAAVPLIAALARRHDSWASKRAFDWLLWRRREALYADDASWGQVGYALVNFKRHRKVANWMSNWRERRDVQPWMLFNYCLALRHLGRYPEATAVARYAIEHWEHRDGGSDLHLFVAVEEALAGHADAAEERLRKVAIRKDVRYDRQMAALIRALVRFHRAPPAERRQCALALRDELDAEFEGWLYLQSMRDARRTFARAGRVFATEGGGISAWWWFKRKLHWQWSLIGLLPLFAVLGAVRPGTVPAALPLLLLVLWLRASKK